MSPILFFDTETTGIPAWKDPSDSEHQPHIVQLAAIVCDEDTGKVLSIMDVIVRPTDDWEIPAETTAIHGITPEIAETYGVPEHLALDMFLNLWRGSVCVAHNSPFDQRIIRIAMSRFNKNEAMKAAWKSSDGHLCTMSQARRIMGGSKPPKLSEAYEHFTGKVLEGAHSAIADARACMEIYFEMKGKGAAIAC